MRCVDPREAWRSAIRCCVEALRSIDRSVGGVACRDSALTVPSPRDAGGHNAHANCSVIRTLRSVPTATHTHTREDNPAFPSVARTLERMGTPPSLFASSPPPTDQQASIDSQRGSRRKSSYVTREKCMAEHQSSTKHGLIPANPDST